MKLELRLFADFRQAVGQKELEWKTDGPPTTIGEIRHELEAEYPELEFFEENGELPIISCRGRSYTIEQHPHWGAATIAEHARQMERTSTSREDNLETARVRP